MQYPFIKVTCAFFDRGLHPGAVNFFCRQFAPCFPHFGAYDRQKLFHAFFGKRAAGERCKCLEVTRQFLHVAGVLARLHHQQLQEVNPKGEAHLFAFSLQDLKSNFGSGRGKRGIDSAAQAAQETLVETGEIHDRDRRGKDHLFVFIDECIEKRVESLSDFGVGTEALDVVDYQAVFAAVHLVDEFTRTAVGTIRLFSEQELLDGEIIGNIEQRDFRVSQGQLRIES